MTAWRRCAIVNRLLVVDAQRGWPDRAGRRVTLTRVHVDGDPPETHGREVFAVHQHEPWPEALVTDVQAVVHRLVFAPPGADEVADAPAIELLQQAGAVDSSDTDSRVMALRQARQLWPDARHLAVFDTPYFDALPTVAKVYALPAELVAEHSLHRRGRHGPVHRLAIEHALRCDAGRVVSIVLGPEASAAAVVDSRPVEVSAGLSPMEGLPGGDTCGDIDPAIPLYLLDALGYDLDRVEDALVYHGGLRGLSGGDGTLADLRATQTSEALAALDLLVHRLRRTIGGLTAVMGGVDAVVFSAEPSYGDDDLYATVAERLGYLGIGTMIPIHARADTPDTAAAQVAARWLAQEPAG